MKNRLNKLYADNRKAAARKFEVVAKADSSEVDIFLYDHIVSSEDEAEWWGGVAPESFVKAVYAVDPSHTINLRVNSPGGSVFAARAMEQALRAHKGKVVVHIDGLAASAATFVSMAGDEVVMAKGAMFMIHKAWTGMWGNAEDLRKEADLLDKIDGTLAETYADKTGKDIAAITEWMAAETGLPPRKRWMLALRRPSQRPKPRPLRGICPPTKTPPRPSDRHSRNPPQLQSQNQRRLMTTVTANSSAFDCCRS